MQRHIDYSNDQKPSNEHHHSNLAQITILHSFRYFPLVKVMLVSTKKNCQLATCYSLLIIFFMNVKVGSKDIERRVLGEPNLGGFVEGPGSFNEKTAAQLW